jgi:CubicO group peptidase (beta-lactamase class C family)
MNMNRRTTIVRLVVAFSVFGCLRLELVAQGAPQEEWPGKTWATSRPEEVGMSPDSLAAAAKFAGGRGCVVRHGRIAFSWGDPARRGDVASASKPIFSYFLFKAVETGRLSGTDALAAKYEPRLNDLNPQLGYKDRSITMRDLANQTSCYGVSEWPGTAFDYNDWQIALFWDTLFTRIYGATYANVDAQVLRPLLTDKLECEDNPTMMEFGLTDRQGRLAISPRDFARFGLLYLRGGRWRTGRLLSAQHAGEAVTSPLPADLPRTKGIPVEMIPGQRSMGNKDIPDNETEHFGSYSWLWWTNGIRQDGRRYWPTAPSDAYACLGHENGQRGMAVIPSLDVVVSWNDTVFGKLPAEPHPVGEFLAIIAKSVQSKTR